MPNVTDCSSYIPIDFYNNKKRQYTLLIVSCKVETILGLNGPEVPLYILIIEEYLFFNLYQIDTMCQIAI